MLEHHRLLELLSYDTETGIFRWLIYASGKALAGSIAGRIDPNGYRYITIEGKRYRAGRLAWFYVHQEWPPAFIDHINRSRDDNSIANLRPATISESNANREMKPSHRGFKGAIFDRWRNRWRAMISFNGKRLFLGNFKTGEEAHTAYCAAVKKYRNSMELP